MLTMNNEGSKSIEGFLCETTFLSAIEELKHLYHEFPLETQVWARDGHRRSPYRALILFGLSPRTKDRLLVEMCRQFFKQFPNLESFLDAGRLQPGSLKNMVRTGQVPFIESVLVVLQKNFRTVPEDAPTLMGIKGAGAKVAECVIGYGWGKEALPVDANVCRVVSRLGGLHWADSRQFASNVRQHLKGLFHRHRLALTGLNISMLDVHELLRLHGQITCVGTPKCWQCPLSHCSSRQSPSPALARPEVSSSLWNDWRELLLDPTCGNIRGNQAVLEE